MKRGGDDAVRVAVIAAAEEEVTHQLAGRSGEGAPEGTGGSEFERDEQEQEPTARAGDFYQTLAGGLAADRRVAAEKVSDANALREGGEEDEPQQAVAHPGAGANDDDRLAGADGNRGEDRRGTEHAEETEEFAGRPGFSQRAAERGWGERRGVGHAWDCKGEWGRRKGEWGR